MHGVAVKYRSALHAALAQGKSFAAAQAQAVAAGLHGGMAGCAQRGAAPDTSAPAQPQSAAIAATLQALQKPNNILGICYLRAGESKGSLTVTSGFERMQYVALHTAGEQCQLFRLQSRGTFQIWTRDTLVAHGFNPRSAAYYIVLHFDGNKPLHLEKAPNLNENSNTFKAKIKSIKEFVIKE